MTNLLRTEWLKIRKYPAFWWMTGIIALTYPGINYIFYNIYLELMAKGNATSQMVKMLLGNPFTFPEVWHTVAYASSIFIFIPSVAVIMFITNEYTYKTHRQNIIDGWSRKQFLTSKLIDVMMVSLLATILFLLVAVAIGLVNKNDSAADIWTGSKYVGLFALQAFAQLSIAFFIAFLVRKAFVALGICLFYFMILEPIMVAYGKVKINDIGRFLPLETSDRMIPVPAFMGRFDEQAYKASMAVINTQIIYTIILTTLIWTLCFWINKKRDL
jgi:hypothetical protein